jgi:NAD(P)-dependent dehydrogenase (short-subunit alcohol dehydrogenase family)
MVIYNPGAVRESAASDHASPGRRQSMPSLKGKVAVVAGASRGAGRGIALALGSAHATTYVVGRTVRGGPKPPDGAEGTIDHTAEEVTARGGKGIAVRVDCTIESDVAALFDRVQEEHGKVDILANAVFGGAEVFATMDEWLAAMGRPFWDQPISQWRSMMTAGAFAYYLTSYHAARLMANAREGLIVGVTDGVIAGASADDYQGQLIWDLSHTCINRLMLGMAVEGKAHGIAVVTLMPGFMRTERVLMNLKTDELKKMFRFDKSESPEYIGRAVAALAADTNVMAKTGKIHFVADLASEYGFTDIDGRYIPKFDPFS